MQSRFTVGVLVLQAEGLVCAICYLGFLFQTTLIIALTVFGLLNQLSGGIVAVGGDFAIPADQYEIVKEQMVQTTSKKVKSSK